MGHSYDVIIIGGGIVGLATAYQLQSRRPELSILVLEKEPAPALHQSSRNSGVIHSGIYYKPGSLKALNCRKGYRMLLEFCRKHEVKHDICGKIIVAVEESERPLLDNIYRRGLENGLDGLRKIGPAEAREIEPHVRAREAVWVPQAGIIDYGDVARKYAELIQAHGGTIEFCQKVRNILSDGPLQRVVTDKTEWLGRLVVNCAGLYADHIGRLTQPETDLKVLPFRGEFYELIPEKEYLVRNLIYPVPNPAFPFLGVHFTRMIHGGIEAGPNAVLAFRREGYGKWDIHPGELFETLSFSGFWKIARKYRREGWMEFQRSWSKRLFVKTLQRLVPEITEADVVPGRSGVRAQTCAPDGALSDDFIIRSKPGVVNVFNAPSPAATASLAVGETIAAEAEKIMG